MYEYVSVCARVCDPVIYGQNPLLMNRQLRVLNQSFVIR